MPHAQPKRGHALALSLFAASLVWASPALASPDSQLGPAAGAGDYDTVKALAERGANLNTPDSEGYTALMWAAQHGNTRVAAYLIEHGANLNPLDNGGYTPLMWAAQEGYFSTVALLLERGANPRVVTRDGRDVATIASYSRDPRVREVLGNYLSGKEKPRVRTAMTPMPGAGGTSPTAGNAMLTSNGSMTTSNNPMALTSGGPAREPDPITKAIALAKLAASAKSAGEDVQTFVKAQTSNFSLSALTDPDLVLGKELTQLYVNVGKTQSLVGCRDDWKKVSSAWGGRTNSRFTRYVDEIDGILKSVAL